VSSYRLRPKRGSTNASCLDMIRWSSTFISIYDLKTSISRNEGQLEDALAVKISPV
jgi:hypothetical protein